MCLVIFSPQFVFVPLMQAAINRRVQSRITVLRQASVDVFVDPVREMTFVAIDAWSTSAQPRDIRSRLINYELVPRLPVPVLASGS